MSQYLATSGIVTHILGGGTSSILHLQVNASHSLLALSGFFSIRTELDKNGRTGQTA
jgi:hypothetical protein